MKFDSKLPDKNYLHELVMDFKNKHPREIIRWAVDWFGERLFIVTSLQINTIAILDMAYKLNPNIHVITIDTGRLPDSTIEYQFKIRKLYPEANWKVVSPDQQEVDKMVKEKGRDLFYESVANRYQCCNIRKVRPLTKALNEADAWISGLRRDQWATRSSVEKIETDHKHGGIIKLNPLADWTEEDVWAYLCRHKVPAHPLYKKGYTSIGCAPCSRPVQGNKEKRIGRWWWEQDAPKECGINCRIQINELKAHSE